MISAGTRLGSYEVVAPIGAGGMGEVYEAHDTKLGRAVAIKVLPEVFAADPDRLARFQREARMLAALNHPAIATIHGLEESDTTHYLVMELVPGETLADRIRRDGPIPVEEALTIAKQMAEALEAAHDKGIIHRDLKPANVKVTPDGAVKVLDFGLAKAFAGEESAADPSNSPTLSHAGTLQGVILGTAAYMSPEQARAKTVDRRTDLWAFGCVLYEMLTGRQAFEGEDVTEILAAVVKTEPDWTRLPGNTPPVVHALLLRCLQKDRTLRMRDAGDARLELQEALTAPGRGVLAAPPVERIRLPDRHGLAVGLGAAIVAALVSGLAVWNLKPTPPSLPRPVSRTVIPLAPDTHLAGSPRPFVTLSPDGTQLAYVARQGDRQQLYLRALNSLETRPLPDTEGASSPFFSPDGRWLGFFAGGQLKKLAVSGGAAISLCEAPSGYGASWGSQGTIAFAEPGASLQQVPAEGGSPQPLTHLEAGEGIHFLPEFLPGGRAVLFSAGPRWRVAVYSLETGERRDLIQGATSAHYVRSGHLVYAPYGGGTLMAVPFDAQRLEVTGEAAPVVEGVMQSTLGPTVAHYSISNTGSLVYVAGGAAAPERTLVWVDRQGVAQPLPAPRHAYFFPRLSPNGERLAVSIADGGAVHVWFYDLRRGVLSRRTFKGAINYVGPWTPDGQRITVASDQEGVGNVFWLQADGRGGLERLTTSENIQAPSAWSPDGQTLAFIQASAATGQDIWVLHLSDRKVQPLLQSPFNETAPSFSPDGHWLAYASDESGRYQIYVQPYPGPGRKWQISTDGGTEPLWNPNGQELFYRSGDRMMAVDVSTQPRFSPGTPVMLFQGPYLPTPIVFPNYDVSADGQRFLMTQASSEAGTSSEIIVVLNWAEELRRLVPLGAR